MQMETSAWECELPRLSSLCAYPIWLFLLLWVRLAFHGRSDYHMIPGLTCGVLRVSLGVLFVSFHGSCVLFHLHELAL